MTERFDAIIVGAGHNGLVCAALLAGSGRRVLVLEAAAHPGGAACTRSFAPGYSVSSGAHFLNMMPRELMEELRLQKHGLAFAARNLATVALDGRGNALRLSGAHAEGGALGAGDAAAYAEFHAETARFAAILARTFHKRPPRLVDSGWQDKLGLLKLGFDIRRLGRDSMQEMLRIGLMNIYDLVKERFDSDLLRSAVAMDAILGSAMGPRSPNTVMTYLYRRVGESFGYTGPALPEGGLGAVGAALAAEAAARGVVLRTGQRVSAIDTEAGRVTGVTLASGERVESTLVVSNADPRSTMKGLVGYRNLDAGFARRIEGIRMKGVAAKLHLALDALPDFPGLDTGALGQRLLLCPGLDALERAFNPSKYSEYSPEPVLEFCIPTLHDAQLAAPGRHVLSAIVQYAPHQLKGGWDAGREAFTQCVLDQLARVAPRIREHVVASELLTPADIEHEFGMQGGHWHHGEIAVDQLLMLRPVPLSAQYRMPIDGLWLCGAGAHPGGGVMGLAGRNCAREIIAREASA